MYGARYFAARYYGARYFGVTAAVVTPSPPAPPAPAPPGLSVGGAGGLWVPAIWPWRRAPTVKPISVHASLTLTIGLTVKQPRVEELLTGRYAPLRQVTATSGQGRIVLGLAVTARAHWAPRVYSGRAALTLGVCLKDGGGGETVDDVEVAELIVAGAL